jgi:tetratricopeptide (TPR) repeat protein
MEEQTNTVKDFTRRQLPWVVMGAALVVYLLTLNPWVTAGNMRNSVQILGWDWQPALVSPLHYLLTLPLKLLPLARQVWALNALSAILGALTLAILARSVSLLPHDRTKEERNRETGPYGLLVQRTAWVAPLIAVTALAFHFGFWQNATAGTGEMLNLLLMAYCIRCLLEYRVSENDGWLFKLALVYGLSIPNNWAMIAAAPLFLTATIWLKGVAFFDRRLLVRLGALTLAGLLCYLVLPLLALNSNLDNISFWTVLKTNLVNQKSHLLFRGYRWPALLLSLCSLVPLLFISIKWATSTGDVNPMANWMTQMMFRLAHLFFGGVAVWVLYHPPFAKILEQTGLEFLPFYYVMALCLGYIAGYYLLVGQQPPARGWAREPLFSRPLGIVLLIVVWVALVAIPARFIARSLPRIQVVNAPFLRQFAEQMYKALPAQGVVAISDDPLRLSLLACLMSERNPNQHVLVSSSDLNYQNYHRHLLRRYPGRWPDLTGGKRLPEPMPANYMWSVLVTITQSNQLYYLHPSFGYFFELYYQQTEGPLQQLKQYVWGQMLPPAITEQQVQFNRRFWTDMWEQTGSRLLQEAHWGLPDVQLVSGAYSRQLNAWGVALQRNARLKEAEWFFNRAIDLLPGNEVAKLNLDFNRKLQTGKVEPVKPVENFWDRFGLNRSLDSILTSFGPLDDPAYCFVAGLIMARNNQHRQAAELFTRVSSAHPDNIEAEQMLGNVYVEAGVGDLALDLVKKARASSVPRWQNITNQIELSRVEALALYVKRETNAADRVLQTVLQRHPRNETALAMVGQVYAYRGMYAEALKLTEAQLQLNPNNPGTLLQRGALFIQINQHALAIEPLTRLLEKNPGNHVARMNRAVANLQSGKLEAARQDYERLVDAFPKYFPVYFGLGEISYQLKETKSAIRQYEAYLKLAPEDATERKLVQDRLNQLKAGKS